MAFFKNDMYIWVVHARTRLMFACFYQGCNLRDTILQAAPLKPVYSTARHVVEQI